MRITDRRHDALIEGLRDVTPTVREFTLRLPANAPSSALQWQAGAHLQVGLRIGEKEVTRHYSLLPPLSEGTLRIAVKRVAPGRGGSAAMWQLRVGDTLRVSEPMNQFPLDLNAPAYFLLAGGIGITPLLGMAQQLAKRHAKVKMLYCASSSEEWAYWDDLQSALDQSFHAVVGPALDLDERIARLPAGAQAYVCGPAGLLQAMQQAWQCAGRSAALLRFETFGTASASAQAFKVLLPRHKLELEVPSGASLLDTLELEGIQAMYGCRKGECGLCALPVLKLDGEIEHHDVFLSAHEKQSNAQICICVSRVKGCITLDTAYRPEIKIAPTTASHCSSKSPASPPL
jgi:ferredoxin-NADP reductase